MNKLFNKLFIEYPKKYKNSINKRLVKFKLEYNLIKRKTAKLTDIETLSFDIPNLVTPEEYIHNDFYFNANHLKKFIGREDEQFLRVSIEHGVYYSYYHWNCDTDCKFPGVITMGEIRRPLLEKLCPEKKIYTIGPYINYVEGFLNEAQLKKEKSGTNLLVFPAHSTHHMGHKFDIEKFSNEILRLSKDFDTTTVCLYWKDILRGCAEDYKKLGFRCVCAGHIYDPLFLPRLKSIIELSDATVSNSVGTHVGYSLHLKKPVYLIRNKMEIITFGTFAKDFVEDLSGSQERNHEENEFFNHFSAFSSEITKEQWDFANQYFGFDKIKTREELKNIIDELDELKKLKELNK